MRKFASLFVLAAAMSLGACAKAEPGYVGIVVSTTGSQKDAKDYPIQRGRIWFNPITEDVYLFPTFTQNVTWTATKHENEKGVDESITFNSVEGATINADIALAYSFEADKVPSIFVEFRRSADEITLGYMRNKVRGAFSDVASKIKVQDIYGAGKQEFLVAVKERLNAELVPKGFKFDMVDMIGQPRIPQNVQVAINASLEATQAAQTAENQLRQTQAEAAKAVAAAEGNAKALVIAAKGEAEANQIRQSSMTAAILRQQAIEKWDGKFPQVVGSGNQLLNLVLGGDK